MSDYLPKTESELYTWLNRFMSFAGTNMAALGLVAADMTAIGQAVSGFQGALAANLAAQQAAKQATNAKDTAKTSCLASVRSLVRQIQAKPTVTDALREGLGIGVKDKSPTPLRAMNDLAMTQPMLSIDRSQHEKHILSVRDTDQTSRRKRPENVAGFEVWSKVDGPPPASASEYSFAGSSRKLLFTLAYDGRLLGKSIYYRVRWVYKDDTRGTWSDMVSAVVG